VESLLKELFTCLTCLTLLCGKGASGLGLWGSGETRNGQAICVGNLPRLLLPPGIVSGEPITARRVPTVMLDMSGKK
jgi:hypothetical protein